MSAARASKRLSSQQSVNGAVKSICDIMRRSNCKGATKYVPELTWILFLRILDELETREAEESAAVGRAFTPALAAPYRWRDWAAPTSALRDPKQGGTAEKVWDFVHREPSGLLATLRGYIDAKSEATPRQRLIAQILSDTPRSRLDSAKNFCDVLDKVHVLTGESVDTTHVFPLSQVYEGLLLKMGEKGNDGGQFFTPREIIRLMVRVTDPQIGQTVYDPGCGTGGFLAEAYAWMKAQVKKPQHLDTLKRRTFYGRETDDMTYPIALANLLLHEIDEPHLWHGNTLTGVARYDGLFAGAPGFFDVVLMNPPFGGKEGKAAQTHFDFQTSSTQCLFLQHVLKHMKSGSTCGIVLDEGLLFRKNDKAFVQTKQKLLEECDVRCIVSLPAGVFLSAVRRREDRSDVLHQGQGHGEDLVFRHFRREGGTEIAARVGTV
jgi:type I restriction enzyme M protein